MYLLLFLFIVDYHESWIEEAETKKTKKYTYCTGLLYFNMFHYMPSVRCGRTEYPKLIKSFFYSL